MLKTLFPLVFPLLVAAATPDVCGSSALTLTLSTINLNSYYTFLTPSASGPKAGTISFILSNSQVNYTTDCHATQSNPFGFFNGYMWWECLTEGVDWPAEAAFSFDTYTKAIYVNATWTCGGDVVYTTSAPGRLDLECSSTTWRNPDWQPGELWSNTTTVCETGELVITR